MHTDLFNPTASLMAQCNILQKSRGSQSAKAIPKWQLCFSPGDGVNSEHKSNIGLLWLITNKWKFTTNCGKIFYLKEINQKVDFQKRMPPKFIKLTKLINTKIDSRFAISVKFVTVSDDTVVVIYQLPSQSMLEVTILLESLNFPKSCLWQISCVWLLRRLKVTLKLIKSKLTLHIFKQQKWSWNEQTGNGRLLFDLNWKWKMKGKTFLFFWYQSMKICSNAVNLDILKWELMENDMGFGFNLCQSQSNLKWTIWKFFLGFNFQPRRLLPAPFNWKKKIGMPKQSVLTPEA